jgi:hypothetical protein
MSYICISLHVKTNPFCYIEQNISLSVNDLYMTSIFTCLGFQGFFVHFYLVHTSSTYVDLWFLWSTYIHNGSLLYLIPKPICNVHCEGLNDTKKYSSVFRGFVRTLANGIMKVLAETFSERMSFQTLQLETVMTW